MRLNLSSVLGDRVTCQLAKNLGLSRDGQFVTPEFIDVMNEFAFSSTSAAEFGWYYLRAQCLSKFRDGNPESAIARETAAMDSFWEGEAHCSAVNARLVDPWTRHSIPQGVLRRARCLVSDVLGPFQWEKFPTACGFGPGATTGLRRNESAQQNKWALSAQITAKAIPYHHAFSKWCSIRIPTDLLVVDANRVTTVPKNYKRDRTIAIEPDWNTFYQHGVGTLIRRRLQRVGLLLSNAQEHHVRLAQLGSADGSLATLDMSNASDTISLALVEALLPEDWLKVVLDLRSEYPVVDGIRGPAYAKVSSMGNGFTFELETLLFFALTAAACGIGTLRDYRTRGGNEVVSVYGDDIICPASSAEEVLSALQTFGFIPNASKSFWNGPFRESCGGHFFEGVDVTPFYLRHHPAHVDDLIVLGNAAQAHVVRHKHEREYLLPTINACRSLVPRKLRGPYGQDGCLWSEWDECTPVWHPGYQSWEFHRIQRKHKFADVSDREGSYLFRLWVNGPDLQASILAKALAKRTLVKSYACQESWSMGLTVR